MRDGRSTCVGDSSDDVVEEIVRLSRCLPVSRLTGAATRVAVVKHSAAHRVCAVHAMRTGHGHGGGWFEYCCRGRSVTKRRDAWPSEERLMT